MERDGIMRENRATSLKSKVRDLEVSFIKYIRVFSRNTCFVIHFQIPITSVILRLLSQSGERAMTKLLKSVAKTVKPPRMSFVRCKIFLEKHFLTMNSRKFNGAITI